LQNDGTDEKQIVWIHFCVLTWVETFDIAGVYDPMIPDSEILRIIVEVAQALTLDIATKAESGESLTDCSQ